MGKPVGAKHQVDIGPLSECARLSNSHRRLAAKANEQCLYSIG